MLHLLMTVIGLASLIAFGPPPMTTDQELILINALTQQEDPSIVIITPQEDPSISPVEAMEHTAPEVEQPAPSTEATAESEIGTTPTSSGTSKWDELAVCESGYGGPGNWDLNTGNGYYGGLQFSLSSWQWVGGTGYPHEHSREEQIKRAEILLERQGWNAWPACSRKLGWR